MALTCPQCDAEMNEVAAPASVGYSIVLDQCPRCGGIWCDRWELYPLSAAAAEQVERVEQTVLWLPTELKKEPLECPRCRARMRRLRDASLPEDACIERCPNCDGMWLNRGELRRFKRRNTSGAATADAITDAQLDQLAHKIGPTSSTVPVRHLSDAFDAVEPAPDDGVMRKEILAGAAWLVARALLRLLLRI